MSFELTTNVHTKDILDFLLAEHTDGTGIPVHPFSVVNAVFDSYNGMAGITDGNGTLFFESGHLLKGYGSNNRPDRMLRALRQCGVRIH